MSKSLPYVNAYGTLGKVLEKIKSAAVPDRFTQDFLSTKLGFKGGSPKPIIPFLKKIGFLGSDGTPTDLYKQFRNPQQAGAAMASAIRKGYHSLYEMNEYLHSASDTDLGGLVVQATGLEKKSKNVKTIVNTFKTLKDHADFEASIPDEMPASTAQSSVVEHKPDLNEQAGAGMGMNLSYTINLNLPPTTDISVFDAIFKSLKENLLKK